MRTGKELILATRVFAVENKLLSWFHTLSTLILIGIAIAGAALPILPIAARAVFSVITGLLMVRAFIIYHDYEHGTIMQHSPLAKVLMSAVGIMSLAPPSIWKASHDFHHKHNSKLFSADIGSYPIMTKEQFAKSAPSERRLYLFIRHPLTMLFGYFFMFLFSMCINPFLNDPRRHWDGAFAFLVHVALLVLVTVFAGWQVMVLAVLLPYFIASAMGSYLFYAQHNFPEASFKTDRAQWTHADAAMESSSYMKMNALMHFFTGNIGYHHIHHLNAKIPFYKLPEAMRSMPELQAARTTSLHPVEIYRCLQLKVYDPDQDKLVRG